MVKCKYCGEKIEDIGFHYNHLQGLIFHPKCYNERIDCMLCKYYIEGKYEVMSSIDVIERGTLPYCRLFKIWIKGTIPTANNCDQYNFK